MSLHHRPTFALYAPAAAESIQLLLQQRLTDPRLEVTWARTPGAGAASERAESHVLITFRPDLRHFWSPWLHLDLKVDDQGTRLAGRFSPHPSVWTGFAFGYLVLTVVSFFALVFGYSQSTIGSTPLALGVLPVSAAVAVVMWWSAQIGQRLARDQMAQIRGLLAESLGDSAHDAAAQVSSAQSSSATVPNHLAPHV